MLGIAVDLLVSGFDLVHIIVSVSRASCLCITGSKVIIHKIQEFYEFPHFCDDGEMQTAPLRVSHTTGSDCA